ncbi:MAG: response regulator [bacterium]|jgi:CheY-like chemotaxis protein
MKPNSIMLVDDDPDLLATFEAVLYSKGYHVISTANKAEALKILQYTPPDLAILDLAMEEEHEGFELARHFRKHYPLTHVIMLTDTGDFTGLNFSSLENNKEWLPAEVYLEKPVTPSQLINAVEEIFNKA